jgi:hypothetical protein
MKLKRALFFVLLCGGALAARAQLVADGATRILSNVANLFASSAPTLGGTGEFLFTNPVNLGEPQRYFRLRTP